MKLLIHEATERQLAAFKLAPGHAVMLTGPKGSGKRQLAVNLIEDIVGTPDAVAYAYGSVVVPEDGKSISIEAVRALERFLSLKVPGSQPINRFILFEDAHLLTREAQNALLKTLEEPPQGSLIVLTATAEHHLLPTIRSRTQLISVTAPSRETAEAHFIDQGHDITAVKRAAAVSGGLPGLMHTLLSDESHPLAEATEYARQTLSKPVYERLLLVDELAKQKTLSLNVCFILQQMAHVSLQRAEGAAAKRWQSVLTAAYEAQEDLNLAVQPKLALANLMLQL